MAVVVKAGRGEGGEAGQAYIRLDCVYHWVP